MNTPSTPHTDNVGEQFLTAIRGERHGLRWLEAHRPGLALFVRALDGGKKAREKLASLTQAEWEDLFAVISDDEVYRGLRKDSAEVAGLVDAIRGDDEVLELFQRQKPTFAQLAQLVREANEQAVAASNGADGSKLEGSTAADVGCLIGEMHLERGEYHKAVEAFTRAIANEPTADAHEGRGRAYRELAALDEARARQLRREEPSLAPQA